VGSLKRGLPVTAVHCAPLREPPPRSPLGSYRRVRSRKFRWGGCKVELCPLSRTPPPPRCGIAAVGRAPRIPRGSVTPGPCRNRDRSRAGRCGARPARPRGGTRCWGLLLGGPRRRLGRPCLFSWLNSESRRVNCRRLRGSLGGQSPPRCCSGLCQSGCSTRLGDELVLGELVLGTGGLRCLRLGAGCVKPGLTQNPDSAERSGGCHPKSVVGHAWS